MVVGCVLCNLLKLQSLETSAVFFDNVYFGNWYLHVILLHGDCSVALQSQFEGFGGNYHYNKLWAHDICTSLREVVRSIHILWNFHILEVYVIRYFIIWSCYTESSHVCQAPALPHQCPLIWWVRITRLWFLWLPCWHLLHINIMFYGHASCDRCVWM